MDLSTLRAPAGATHKKKRVGRGEGSGTGVQSGRGHKGQKSRSGYKSKRGFEGGQMPIHRRLPKRGFHNPFRVEYVAVNLDRLCERFDDGAEVTPDALRACRLVRDARAPIKILGRGEATKALQVSAHAFSARAREAIVAAGGRVDVVPRKGGSEAAGSASAE